MMNSLEGIISLADKELSSIVNNGKFRSREEIESAEKLVKMAEKIFCIWDMEESGEEGYSNRNSYRDGGMSYARNRRRDSMGRYSREGGGSYAREGGSYARRGGGYSSHGDFAEELRSMMEDAPDEQTRQNIQRMLEQMGR